VLSVRFGCHWSSVSCTSLSAGDVRCGARALHQITRTGYGRGEGEHKVGSVNKLVVRVCVYILSRLWVRLNIRVALLLVHSRIPIAILDVLMYFRLIVYL